MSLTYSDDPDLPEGESEKQSPPNHMSQTVAIATAVGTLVGGVMYLRNRIKVTEVRKRYEKYLDAVAIHGEHHV